jgi:hypothetical protein
MDDDAASATTRLRVRNPLPDVGAKVLSVVDRAVENRWESAQRRARDVAHLDRRAAVREVSASIRRELIATGAASGAAAAMPGVGTAVTAASLGGDLVVATVRLSELILTVGAIHGHHGAPVEERRLWVLSVLAFGDGASEAVRRIAAETAKGSGRTSTARVSVEVLRRVNRSLAKTVLAKYGRTRGMLAIGKLFPFGVGAAIGAGGNAMLVRTVARSADRFMGDLPFRVT